MLYYALGIFLSAFLLFQVQPMIAKYILPWFGGTPAVWSTVQLFFQVLLTGGYAYAHWLVQGRLEARRERIHLILLALVILQLGILSRVWASPITPDASWQPHGIVDPISNIFILLLISVGPAYFILSTNSPLVQAWFHRESPDRSPYVLYALSNIGSLLGLISYPVLVEPRLTVQAQGGLWAVGVGLFAVLAVIGAIRVQRMTATPSAQALSQPVEMPRLGVGIRALWLLLSACASILFLATTSYITQDVAVIPFLWILPLIIYLLSFIFTFSSERWYSRQIFLVLFFLVSIVFVRILYAGPTIAVPIQLTVLLITLFIACMICHGELYRRRPEPSHITQFYLLVSVGGALGGIFVNFIAPNIFRGFWELPLGIVLCWTLLFAVTLLYGASRRSRRINLINRVLSLSGVLLLLVFSIRYIIETGAGDLFVVRNFYGIVRVQTRKLSDSSLANVMINGITVHGLELLDPARRDTPTAYYYEQSGIGLAILNSPQRGHQMRVGVLGLGAGTLAVYGQRGDVYRFYEINPVVIDLAKGKAGYFSFLSDSKAQVEIVPGDARISMEQEIADGHFQNYDILALDTFSSDSIPVHLLDQQAFAVYLQQLRPDGVLAVHITNTFLDLKPVVFQLAKFYHLELRMIQSAGNGATKNTAVWMLLSRDAARLSVPAISEAATPLDHYKTDVPLWTDDYSNLFLILSPR